MYPDLMALADDLMALAEEALTANQRVRVESAELRAAARDLRFRRFVFASWRYPKTKTCDDERTRSLLLDLIFDTEPIRSCACDSRGVVCEVCGYEINENEVELLVGVTTPELRLDVPCYAALIELREDTMHRRSGSAGSSRIVGGGSGRTQFRSAGGVSSSALQDLPVVVQELVGPLPDAAAASATRRASRGPLAEVSALLDGPQRALSGGGGCNLSNSSTNSK